MRISMIVLSWLFLGVVLYRFILYDHSFIERIYLSAFSTFLVTGVCSFLLFRLSIYSAHTVSGILLVLAFSLWALRRDRSSNNIIMAQVSQIGSPAELLAIGFVLILAFLFYAAFPTYYLLGGRDPGLYLIYSVQIARTGELNLNLPWVSENWEQFGEFIRLGYPGIYSAYARGLSEDPGVLIPQFMHLFPAFAAIAYEFGGIEGVARTNAGIAMFTISSMFVLLRRVIPFRFALLGALLLGLNAAFLWNVRITLTETLAATLLLGGVYLTAVAFQRQHWAWGLFAGAVLGLGVLNRIDAMLISIFVCAVCISAARSDDVHRRNAWAILLAYSLVSSLAIFDGYIHSFPYFYDLWQTGSMKGLIAINYIGISIGLFTLLLSQKLNVFPHFENFIKCGTGLAIAVGFAVFMFAFMVRPLLGDSFNHRAVLEMHWYLPVTVVALGLYGAWTMIKISPLEHWVTGLICLSVVSLVVFSFRPSITPEHIWASRRWVSQVIPLFLFLGAVGVSALWKRSGFMSIGKVIGGSSLALYFATAVVVASPYASNSILEEYPRDLEKLASTVGADMSKSRIFSRSTELASILTYVYDTPTALLNDFGVENIRDSDFNSALFVGELSGPRHRISQAIICGDYLEKVRGSLPRKLYRRCNPASVYKVGESAEINMRYAPTEAIFGTQNGVKNDIDKSIVSNGNRGFLLFGPYVALPRGRYRVDWSGSLFSSEGHRNFATFDVAHRNGQQKIGETSLTDQREGEFEAHLEFELQDGVDDIEFRVFVEEGVVLRLEEVLLRAIDANAPSTDH